ncbi:hypothetical protein IMZ11_20085 [Microtetraspora sp. AC03309]|uniref:DUF6297 family protein n=1 Tax=Microtetraspora sp. AC03309 TaxID=2779376 RepID=UPI001E4CB738|nr:DUF6297 family protein [Microtetraspora sp. AC03309]MCC5577929.1 hypothetical protein [Microtetraspora sp. AC03309]
MNTLAAARAIIRAPRARRTRTWQDRYTLVFAVVLLGAIAADPLSRAWNRLLAPVADADPTTMGTGLALIVLAYAGLVALARLVGPVALSPADATWLVLSPLDRRAVLRPAVVRLLVVSVVAGTVLGIAALAVLGVPDLVALRVTGAVVIGVAACVGGAALAVLAQRSDTEGGWLSVAFTVIAVLAIVAGLAAASGAVLPWRSLLTSLPRLPASAVMAAATGAALASAAVAVRAWRALPGFPTRAVIASSVRTGQATDALLTLEPTLLTWIAEDNHWRARRLRSRRWPRLPAPLAVAWVEARRLGRHPARLAVLLAVAALPALAAVASGGITPLVVVALLAGALSAATSGTSGARRDSENPGLGRLLGATREWTRAARAIPPALLAAAWLAAALAGLAVTGLAVTGPVVTGAVAGASWWAFVPLCAPPLAVAALRIAGCGPIDHSLPVIDTPGGPVPMGPLLWAFTGIDVATLGCAPALAALLARPASPAGFLIAQAAATLLTAGVFLASGARPRRRP